MKKPKFWNWLDDADSGERTLMLCGTISDEAWSGCGGAGRRAGPGRPVRAAPGGRGSV